MFSKYFLPTLGLSCGIVLFFAGRLVYVDIKNSQNHFTPQEVKTTLHPTQGALTASVSAVLGTVKKEGREDTEFKSITDSTTLVQGESLVTDYNGLTVIVLPHIAMQVGVYTQIDFLNGLPDALVFRQPNGKVTYTIDSDIKPFSVRSLALLTQFANASKVVIQTDADAQTVTVRILSGDVTVAYSDNQNNTQVKKLTKGDIGVFDNTASTLTVE